MAESPFQSCTSWSLQWGLTGPCCSDFPPSCSFLTGSLAAVQQPQKHHCLLLPLGFVSRGDSTGSWGTCKARHYWLELTRAAPKRVGSNKIKSVWKHQQIGKAEVGCETFLPQTHCIKASPRVEGWIQSLHRVAITLSNWGTHGLDRTRSAFLMKPAGQFFRDPWHSVLWGTEGCIL